MAKNKREEKNLLDALSWCGLKKLPEKDNGEDIWIEALAKVSKANGSIGYVYIKKNGELKDVIAKDFGDISMIVKIDEVYPFNFLKASFMPTFKANNKNERIHYLQKIYKSKDFSGMTVKQLDTEILKVAINNQLNHERKQKL